MQQFIMHSIDCKLFPSFYSSGIQQQMKTEMERSHWFFLPTSQSDSLSDINGSHTKGHICISYA